MFLKLKSLYFLFQKQLQRRMGCQESAIGTYSQNVSVVVIDPSFLKPSKQALRNTLQSHGVQIKTYMSVDCFMQDNQCNHLTNVVVREQEVGELLQGLMQLSVSSKVFAIRAGKGGMGSRQKKVTYLNSYEDLLGELNHKPLQKKQQRRQKLFVEVKILKNVQNEDEPQLFIFEETLKAKKVSYQIYSSIEDFQLEIEVVESPIVVTDYLYHEEVIALLSLKKTKIFCLCDLKETQSYHPSLSLFTNNFQQIVNQIITLRAFKLPPLPATKVFLCSQDPTFFKYQTTFEEFDLKVRAFKSVKEILRVAKYYFSLMIICPEEQKNRIDKEVAAFRLQFRVQVVGVMEGTENSPLGLRKTLRQVKRGYLVEKGVCKMVEIIDPFHSDSKFQDLKKELTKHSINFRCFNNFSSFENNEVYCAPLIICNFDERYQLSKYLEKVQSRAKVIIFCNKHKISEALLKDKKWAFVNSHFGKVVNYIRTSKALIPVILDHNQKRMQLRQQNIKNKQHRISALKWSDQNVNPKLDNNSKIHKLPSVSFIVPKLNINPLEVKQISNDASALLKLPYAPSKQLAVFKEDLITSLNFLKDRYKINFPEQAFADLLDGVKDQSLQGMAMRVRQFFGDEKEMGLKMNKSLRNLESLDEKELKHLREVVYLINLNFISYYEMQRIGSVRLVHWTKEPLLEQSLPEGVAIFKNFMVMYQEGTIDPIPGCLKLQLQLNYDSLTDSHLPIVPYFCFGGRYVFAPYTQFKITGLSGENQSVASLQLIKQPDFLSYYFEENLSARLGDYFLDNLSNSGSLVDISSREKVLKHIERCSILRMYRTGSHEKAAKRQKLLLAMEEQTQNIDNRYLTELLYELAHYQFKSGLIDDLLVTVGQVANNDPPPLIKKDCSMLLSKARSELANDFSIHNPLQVKHQREKTIRCIELKETIEKAEPSEKDQSEEEEEAFEANVFEFQRCLQIDDHFGEFQYVE